MEIRFLLTENISEKENKEVTEINNICFADVPDEECELDFVDALGKEKTNDSVMILGMDNKELADKILDTNYKFHYGRDSGYW